MPRYLLIDYGRSVKTGNTIITAEEAMCSNDKELQKLGNLGKWYQDTGRWNPGIHAPLQDYLRRARSMQNQVKGIDKEVMESKLMEIVGAIHSHRELLVHDWARVQLPQRLILQEREQGITGLNYGVLRPGEEGNLTEQEIDEANAQHEREAGAEQGTGAAEATQDQPAQSGEDPEGEK